MRHKSIKTPLFQTVAHLLRRRILLKELQPGEHVNEVTVSRELNLSRGPIRDAIKLLEKEGLVETFANGRTLVTGFTRDSFRDWMRIRLSLERLAIDEFAAKREAAAGRVDGLLELVRGMVALEGDPHRLDEAVELDLRFHSQLVSMSGNRTLVLLWESVYGPLTTIMELIARHYGDIPRQTDMHRDIAERLLRRDYAGAADSLQAHIAEGEQTMLAALRL